MIFNFRIVSDEVDNFKREINIDSTATFMDLRNAICDCTGYDKNVFSSFFLCDEDWEKKLEITSDDMDFDADQDFELMDDAILGDLIEEEGQKLLYVFDYMTDRAFFVVMTEMIPDRSLKDAVCSLSVGKAPAQTMDIDEFDAIVDAKAAKGAVTPVGDDDLDADFYGADAYNEDEFDADSFSDLMED
ncbi:MAG: hypothetical protein K2M06_08980 [Muribaculaceae bacterium]|nr:hypothetical protein [Muribaculaceae bacterium]